MPLPPHQTIWGVSRVQIAGDKGSIYTVVFKSTCARLNSNSEH